MFFEAPPSKAHTLRALLLGSLSKGVSTVRRPLLGQDQRHMIECLKNLGVGVEIGSDVVRVHGNGGWYEPIGDELNVGDSGVSMNFLAAAVCLSQKPIVVTGAPRLRERPIQEVVRGLRQLGCQVDFLGEEGFPPIKVASASIPGGRARIRGGTTSQYFSSLAIACAYAKTPVILECIDRMSERPYFDITLEMMSRFGVEVSNRGYREIRIPSGSSYNPSEMVVEGDYSSASFLLTAAAICRSRVTVAGLSADTRQGDRRITDILSQMGCTVQADEARILVQGGDLRAITVDMRDTPDLVVPIAVTAAFAKGRSRLGGVGHLRHKECDRLSVLVSELRKMGVSANCDDDSLEVEGAEHVQGARIDPHNDHRIAMSFAIAGLAVDGLAIENEQCVAKSFPGFWEQIDVFVQ